MLKELSVETELAFLEKYLKKTILMRLSVF